MPINISYDEGDFTIQGYGLSVYNLEVVRARFRELIPPKARQIVKEDWEIGDPVAPPPFQCILPNGGYYRKQCFRDEYFFRGLMIRINGVTHPHEETFTASCFSICRDGVEIKYINGVKGRAPSLSDPGRLEVSIEGYRNIGKRKPTIANLTQLRGLPKLLQG